MLDSRPYRLRTEVAADFLTVTRRLEQGRVADALDAYAGPLLPSSDAPGIVRLRHLIDSRLRAAVLTGGDPGLIQTFLGTAWGADDLEMWEAYAASLPSGSPARPLAIKRVAELTAEYGLATSLQRPRN